MSGGSEEKNLPASATKLRKEREKGRIAKSPDLYAAVAALTGFTLILVLMPDLYKSISELFDAASHAQSLSWEAGLDYMKTVFFSNILIIISPVLIAVSFAVIISNVIYNQGVPISFDPLKPQFKRLNPADGFKRIFGKRGIIESAQKFVRLIIWIATCTVIIWIMRADLFNSVFCEGECTAAVAQSLTKQLVIAAIIILLVIALFDMPIQKALFLHEMKMGKSEQKRESKEQHGSPEIRSARQRLYNEIMNSPSKLGVNHSTFVLYHEDQLIGIHYKSGSGYGPIIVAKTKGAEKVKAYLETAKDMNIPAFPHPDLVKGMANAPNGTGVPPQFYDDLARVIAQNQYLLS